MTSIMIKSCKKVPKWKQIKKINEIQSLHNHQEQSRFNNNSNNSHRMMRWSNRISWTSKRTIIVIMHRTAISFKHLPTVIGIKMMMMMMMIMIMMKMTPKITIKWTWGWLYLERWSFLVIFLALGRWNREILRSGTTKIIT